MDSAAAVTIGILSGSVGGALVTAGWRAIETRSTRAHERQQQWRQWQQDAAAELATRLGGTTNAVENAVRRVETAPEDRATVDAVAFARVLVDETSLPYERVKLLFGDADGSEGASEAIRALREAVERLEARDAAAARVAASSAADHAAAFAAAARAQLRV